MGASAFVVGLAFLVCLILAAILFSVLPDVRILRENLLSAAVAISSSLVVGAGSIVAFWWYPYDFVGDVGIWNYLIPLFSCLIIVASFFVKMPFAVSVGTLIASVTAVLGSQMSITFVPWLPAWANLLGTIGCLWVFAMGYRSLSGLNPLPQMTGMSICLGFIILYFLDDAPFGIAVSSSGLLAILMIAYLNSKAQPIGISSAPLLGFILGCFGLISYGEYLLPCFVIFSMFYFLEFGFCLFRKITLLPQYADFAYNSASVQAFVSGFPPAAIIRVVVSTNVLLLILGLFQINGINAYSIPVFSGLIVAWQLYRMINWQQESLTLKETNQEFIREIKDTVGKVFNKDDSNTQADSDKDDETGKK